MTISDLTSKPLWQTDKSMDHERIKQIEFIVPMPDFSLRLANEFEALDQNDPTRLVKNIFERFPVIEEFYTQHPAFQVALTTLNQNPIGNLGVMDMAWHREVLRRNRMRAEIARIYSRQDFERYVAELNAQREIRRELDKRAFHFGEAVKNRLRQTAKLNDTADRRIARSEQIAKRGLEVHDEAKRTAFIMLYLRYFTESKQYLKRRAKKIQENPSLSQLRAMKSSEKTPFEIVVEEARKLFPILQKDEVARLFEKWQKELNIIVLQHRDHARFRQEVARMFYKIFVFDSEKGFFARRKTDKAMDETKRIESLNLNKRIASLNHNKALANEHVAYLERNRSQFEKLMNDLSYSRLVTKKYEEQKSAEQKHNRELERYVPTSFEGFTDWLPKDPVKYQTQYSLITNWVNQVTQLIAQKHRNAAELAQVQRENFEEHKKFINATTLESAVEVQRIVDAQRNRDLLQHYTLDQIVDMFAATASAANMIKGYHTNSPSSSDAAKTQTDPKHNVHKVSEVKNIDPAAGLGVRRE